MGGTPGLFISRRAWQVCAPPRACPELVVESASSIEAAHLGGRRIVELDPLPDAIFCASFMRLGMMRALNERDLDCPQDVAVAGFDDFQRADSFRPAADHRDRSAGLRDEAGGRAVAGLMLV